MKKIPKDIDNKLKKVIRLVEEAASTDGTVAECFSELVAVERLATCVGMSQRSLSGWFKRTTGVSIGKYANQRRAEYVARILRCFPSTTNSDISQIVGFAYPNALYSFMRRYGVGALNDLRTELAPDVEMDDVSFRIDRLPDAILFFKMAEVNYDDCGSEEYERENWDEIELYVADRFAGLMMLGYVGIAVDRYLIGDYAGGVFMPGVLYEECELTKVLKDTAGSIGWKRIPARHYAVFSHRGSYEMLGSFYNCVIRFIRANHAELRVDVANPFMERYLNSPKDVEAQFLVTELWVPLETTMNYSSSSS